MNYTFNIQYICVVCVSVANDCIQMCVCFVCTDLAARVHVEQTHSARQLFGILNAVPQYTGGEVQRALIRLTKNTHTHKHHECSS